mmetsp:Transcript_25889/g.62368  ORF Transcript_25889/g.62368 Transcript_25889/m.62368 type:complete len:261 (+) Transcript_25889:641-1423(+)
MGLLSNSNRTSFGRRTLFVSLNGSTLRTRIPRFLSPAFLPFDGFTCSAARMPMFSIGCQCNPKLQNPMYFPCRSMSLRKCSMTGVGMMYPMFSASSSVSNATPTTLFSRMAGPPLFPAFIAASIWTARSDSSVCEYLPTPTRLTMPWVTLMLSPPVGYPTTFTLSCRLGMEPSSRGTNPSQKASSSTVRTARSHSCPTWRTLATNFLLAPCLRIRTTLWNATPCALPRIRRPGMTKPELVEESCRFICQGSEKCGSVYVQ